MRRIEGQDIEMIEKFHDIVQRGYYCNSVQVTSLYNKVLEKNVPNTNCSSCLRGRISELWNALVRQREQDQITAKKAEEEARLAEEKKEENNDGDKGTPPKTTRRKKSKKSDGV